MKVTRTTAAEVAANLTPTAKKLLSVFIAKGRVMTGPKEFIALIELLAKRILRADVNLMNNEYILVLENGGKHVVEVMRKQEKKS